MPDEIDWSLTTFEGNRRRQHEEFAALSFREKLTRIEELSAVAARLAPKRHARSTADRQAAERCGEAAKSSLSDGLIGRDAPNG